MPSGNPDSTTAEFAFKQTKQKKQNKKAVSSSFGRGIKRGKKVIQLTFDGL
jgi:hypothetical protein